LRIASRGGCDIMSPPAADGVGQDQRRCISGAESSTNGFQPDINNQTDKDWMDGNVNHLPAGDYKFISRGISM